MSLDIAAFQAAPEADERLQVGGDWRVWWLTAPLIVGILALAAGILAAFARHPAGTPLAAIGLGGLVAAGIAAIVVRNSRRWITVLPQGFRVENQRGVREYGDGEVGSLSCCVEPRYAAGRLTGETRRVVLWLGAMDAAVPLSLVDWFPLGADDPLQPLIRRLMHRLTAAASDLLASGGRVEGEGWNWQGDQLQIAAGGSFAVIQPSDVTALERLGRELRLWRANELHPAASLPVAFRNAWLLEALLRRQVMSSAQTVVKSPHRLGRVLFERRLNALVPWTTTALGGFAVLVSLFLIAVGVFGRSAGLAALGIGIGTAGSLVFVSGRRLRRSAFRCHERGIAKVGLSSTQELSFDEVDVFSYDARRQYSHARYVGTLFTLVFAHQSRPGAGIFFTQTVPHEDDELERLRESVAEHLARRMARTFATAQSVQWTPELWFRAEGLEYRRKGLLRFAGEERIAYSSILDFEIADGWFHLWTNSQERAAVKVKTSSPNFYPGVLLFEALARRHAQTPKNEWRPPATEGSEAARA